MDLYEKAFAIILVIVLVGEINVMTQPSFVAKASVTLLGIEFRNQQVTVSYSIKQGTYPNIMTAALVPVRQPLTDRSVFIYYDKDYPSSFVVPSAWLGIIDHMEENMRLKGYHGELRIVNASGIKEIMLHEHNSVLIIPSGVLPETVHTREYSLVKQYLENGGILVWIGDVFAYHSGRQGRKIVDSLLRIPGLEAQEKILGYVLSDSSPFDTGDSETSWSEALSLKYPGMQTGIIVEEILKHDGLVLGKTKEGRTSIAMVPVGSGFLVLFGGGMTTTRTLLGEDSVASDIANILLSGVVYSNGQVAYQTTEREDAYGQTLRISLNSSVAGSVFFVVSDDYYSYFLYRRFIP